MAKWIFRLALLAVVLFGAQMGLHRLAEAYQIHKTEKAALARIDTVSPGDRKQAALLTYLTFYWGNVSIMPSICKDEGIDLKDYAKAFKQRYAVDHALARDALVKIGVSEQAVIAGIGAESSAKEAFRTVLIAAGKAARKSESVADGCRAFQEKPDKVIEKMNFRDAYPAVWAVTGLS